MRKQYPACLVMAGNDMLLHGLMAHARYCTRTSTSTSSEDDGGFGNLGRRATSTVQYVHRIDMVRDIPDGHKCEYECTVLVRQLSCELFIIHRVCLSSTRTCTVERTCRRGGWFRCDCETYL